MYQSRCRSINIDNTYEYWCVYRIVEALSICLSGLRSRNAHRRSIILSTLANIRGTKTWKNRIKSVDVVGKYYHRIKRLVKASRPTTRRVTSQWLYLFSFFFLSLLLLLLLFYFINPPYVTQVCGRQSVAGNRTTFYAKNVPIRGSRKKRRSARTPMRSTHFHDWNCTIISWRWDTRAASYSTRSDQSALTPFSRTVPDSRGYFRGHFRVCVMSVSPFLFLLFHGGREREKGPVDWIVGMEFECRWSIVRLKLAIAMELNVARVADSKANSLEEGEEKNFIGEGENLMKLLRWFIVRNVIIIAINFNGKIIGETNKCCSSILMISNFIEFEKKKNTISYEFELRSVWRIIFEILFNSGAKMNFLK